MHSIITLCHSNLGLRRLHTGKHNIPMSTQGPLMLVVIETWTHICSPTINLGSQVREKVGVSLGECEI
jgi:hypothetical protein